MEETPVALNRALTSIVENKKNEVRVTKRIYSKEMLIDSIDPNAIPRSLFGALKREGRINVIAEIKRSSPSVMLKPSKFNPAAIARSYEKAGAVAISVLTDSRFFCGAPVYVPIVREAVNIPVLRKEFIVDPWQLYETAALGADAVLLMPVALSGPQEVADLYHLALELEIEPLVEIHSLADWEMVEGLKPKIIGINNRDFLSPDLKIDIGTTERVAPYLPKKSAIVSESGVSTAGDVAWLSRHVDAFLIGSAFMGNDDPGNELNSLLAESRRLVASRTE